MKQNIGNIDRVIRLIIGVVIVALGIYTKTWWGILGIILIFTATIKTCPLYLPFGISTCKTKEVKK